MQKRRGQGLKKILGEKKFKLWGGGGNAVWGGRGKGREHNWTVLGKENPGGLSEKGGKWTAFWPGKRGENPLA